MKLIDRKLTKVFFSSEIRIGPDNPKPETGTSQFVTSWPPSTPNKQDHGTSTNSGRLKPETSRKWTRTCRIWNPRAHFTENNQAQSWGRLQMIGIRTSTTLTGGAVLQLGAVSYKGQVSSSSQH